MRECRHGRVLHQCDLCMSEREILALKQQILALTEERDEWKRKFEAIPKWTCFNCGFETSDEKEASAHFGDQDDATSLCHDWAKESVDEHLKTCQQYIIMLDHEREENYKLRQQNEALEYQVGTFESTIKSYKPFRECKNIQDVFNVYDSMEGQKIVAEQERDALKVDLQARLASAEGVLDEIAVLSYDDACDHARDIARKHRERYPEGK